MIKGYLDNASSTECKFFAKDFYVPGNPNSPHGLGLKAHEALEEAKQRVKDCLGVKGGEVVFCRCATDAVIDLGDTFGWRTDVDAYSKGLYSTYCSPYEHDSVLAPCDNHLPIKEYFEDYYVGEGLYLHQYVNQITGTVFDISSMGKAIREEGGYFGSDFTASIGHAPLLDNLEDFCDAVWFSGHKIHAEQGIGALWIGDRLIEYFKEINYMFPGTPNVSGAVAMSYAMEHAVDWDKLQRVGSHNKHYAKLFDYLNSRLVKDEIPFHYVEMEGEKYTMAINAITLPGFNADALVTYLSSRGVYISAGHSACSGDNPDASRVLEAFGLTKEEASQTVRISFCEDSSPTDIDMLVDGIVSFREKFMD